MIVEHCLCHGLRRSLPVTNDNCCAGDVFTTSWFLRHSNEIFKRAKDRCTADTSVYGQSCLQPDPWLVLLQLEQLVTSCNHLRETVNNMSELRTGFGGGVPCMDTSSSDAAASLSICLFVLK
ncbi:hypothetical protein PHET_12343 [Paragonimus heterotremus]|uniref:Uncharacterized protein n=1 Tax=Paragonimus heterotremus TaxID=100268 RepID=A0A8J4WCJ7_9TREM|nr:hypothetical protein PHET_12343 [Paragonimus heterotremus]